jgi:hypothetical protein
MTPEEIEAQMRADYPTLSRRTREGVVVLTEEEYDARIAEMVTAEVAWQAREAERALEQTARDKARAAYARLKAGTATNAQVQEVVAWLLRQQIRDLEP